MPSPGIDFYPYLSLSSGMISFFLFFFSFFREGVAKGCAMTAASCSMLFASFLIKILWRCYCISLLQFWKCNPQHLGDHTPPCHVNFLSGFSAKFSSVPISSHFDLISVVFPQCILPLKILYRSQKLHTITLRICEHRPYSPEHSCLMKTEQKVTWAAPEIQFEERHRFCSYSLKCWNLALLTLIYHTLHIKMTPLTLSDLEDKS